MNHKVLDALMQKLVPVIHGGVLALIEPLKNEIAELKAKQPLNGKDGKDGIDGINGKDADANEIAAILEPTIERVLESKFAEAVASLPQPKDGVDGQDGKSVDPEEVMALCIEPIKRAVDEAVALIPLPQDGKDGKDGVDGESVKIEDVVVACSEAITSAVTNEVAKIPVPKDGVPGADGKSCDVQEVVAACKESIERNIHDAVEKFVASVVIPKDGADGRDGTNGSDGKDASLIIVDEDLAFEVPSAVQLLHESPPIARRGNGHVPRILELIEINPDADYSVVTQGGQ